MPRNRLINPANGLTLSRFVMAPIVLWLVLKLQSPDSEAFLSWVAPAIFIVMAVTILTDLFDGMVARGYNVVTNFGKIMDPVADSTFYMTFLFAMSVCPRTADHFPIWFPIIVLWREVAMQVLRRYSALRGIVLAAKMSGKAKMFVQSVVTTGLMAAFSAKDLGWMDIQESSLLSATFICGIIVVVVNVLSLIEYMKEVPELLSEGGDESEKN
ncbi:MAG: CDP-alcohol phosphatidyltransferase family protein [Planctomycetes bacterium]|nr:CDP-alcohol phosphatidyltransferase family protein [Planctomycetota bacterium]